MDTRPTRNPALTSRRASTLSSATMPYNHTAQGRLLLPRHLAVGIDGRQWKSRGWLICTSTSWVYEATSTDTVSTSGTLGSI